MTTTVALVCKEGVVLVSDGRATMGSLIASKDAQKTYKVSDRIGITIAGGVGDAQMLLRIISREARLYEIDRREPMSVKAISTLLSNILNANKYNPYMVQLIVGGIDKKGMHVSALDLAGGFTDEKEIAATGSGSPAALGVLENKYVKNMPIAEGQKIAIEAVYSATKRDSATGELIRVVTITEQGYKEEITEDLTKKGIEEFIKTL
jgi:proteasome beta subunit